ncbi:MAG: DUF2752 domain-containing protein [Clostridiales Family XIII bacterium]|jgi:hypothetical protein|nr:DUF2752 domain-containing protein [Clostridiales Family XIII bacterium]
MLKRWIWIPFAAGLVLLFVVGCPIKLVTGIPCPGCGMTRAFLAAARFDFAEAFLYHPLFPLMLLGIVVVIVQAVRYIVSSNKRIRDLGYEDVNALLTGMAAPLAGRIAIAVFVAMFLALYFLRVFVTLSGIGGVLDLRVLL